MSSTTISSVPTGAVSPSTILNKYVCLVYPGGNIGYGSGNFIVSFSYGKNTPSTDWDVDAFCVYPSGYVVGSDYSGYVGGSYGRIQSPNMDGDGWVCCVHSSGFVGDGHNHVNYNSYGTLRTGVSQIMDIFAINMDI